MSPEERALLNKSVELAEDNHRMLKALHRSMRTRRIMSIIYWVLIIGSTVGAWYFVQPYVDQVISTYTGAKSNFENFSDFFKNIKK
jgi:hypothetical protein